MYCGNCGTYNEKNLMTCQKCGMKLTNNSPKKESKNNNLKLLIIVVPIVILVIVLCIILFSGGKKYTGTWHCKGYNTYGETSKDYMITMILNSNGTYTFGQYGDLDNNHSKGKYTAEAKTRTKQGEEQTYYYLDFESDEFIVDGKEQQGSNKVTMQLEMIFVNNKETIISNARTSAMYYCNR